MSRITVTIYPNENGNLIVDATKDKRSVEFITKSKNLILILFRIEIKFFLSWFIEKFFTSAIPDSE